MNTKKSTTTVETSDKSDNKTNRNSFTQEISKDIKTVVASVKKNNPKMAGILSLVAAGIWVFCLLLGALVPITVAGLSVVSFVLLICVTILVVIAWKKSSSSKTKGFKKQELTKKFLLIAFIACVISLVIGIFAMPAAYLA
jgi:Flp pilus assembly protein TadB